MRTAPVLLLLLGLAAAPVRAQTPSAPLPIPLPPGVAVQMELDGKDADLLGMVKSLLTGAASKVGAGADAVAGGNPFLGLLGDGQLTALFKDIHHLHVVSFKPANATPLAAPADFLAFYEKPFEAKGGHRLLYLGGGTPAMTVGFDQPRGFAAVVQSGGAVTVVRTDGYPDMAVVGSLLRAFGAAVPLPNMPTPAPAARKAGPKATRPKARG